jgi:hypothetical protein
MDINRTLGVAELDTSGRVDGRFDFVALRIFLSLYHCNCDDLHDLIHLRLTLQHWAFTVSAASAGPEELANPERVVLFP